MKKYSIILVVASLSLFTLAGKAAGIENSASSSQLPSLKWTQNSLVQSEPTQPPPPPSPSAKPVESEPTVDKSKYNLFSPTPKKYWRDFATDRPDKTETPFTTDAGNWIMEADLFVYTKNNNAPDGTVTENYQVFVPNFKIGLTNNLDFQIIIAKQHLPKNQL